MDSTPSSQPFDDIWLSEYRGQLPPTLNVLTILTIIWSAFSFSASLFTFLWAPISYRNAQHAQDTFDQMTQMPPFVRSLFGNTLEATRVAYVNRVPILLIGLLGALFCLAGALQMRKRKRSGFILYVVGDVLPLASLFFFMVMSLLAGIGTGIGYGIAIVFIILYATQLKYMR
jgi:hypothetical protein